nr:uncharacterized protein LOC111413625 [Onthophagus taurus]
MRWESMLRPRNLIVCPVSGSLLLDFPRSSCLSLDVTNSEVSSASNQPLSFVVLYDTSDLYQICWCEENRARHRPASLHKDFRTEHRSRFRVHLANHTKIIIKVVRSWTIIVTTGV